MKKNELNESRMLLEVWKMKEKIYNETKNMQANDFFKYINEKAALLRKNKSKISN